MHSPKYSSFVIWLWQWLQAVTACPLTVTPLGTGAWRFTLLDPTVFKVQQDQQSVWQYHYYSGCGSSAVQLCTKLHEPLEIVVVLPAVSATLMQGRYRDVSWSLSWTPESSLLRLDANDRSWSVPWVALLPTLTVRVVYLHDYLQWSWDRTLIEVPTLRTWSAALCAAEYYYALESLAAPCGQPALPLWPPPAATWDTERNATQVRLFWAEKTCLCAYSGATLNQKTCQPRWVWPLTV